MNILWITNIILPAACKELGIDEPIGGGWLESSAKELSKECDIKLAIATSYSSCKEIKTFVVDNLTYYLIPNHKDNSKYNKSLEPFWDKISDSFKPDIVHIHGTELAHGLAFLRACPDIKSIVSIQGLVSVIARYYLASMNNKEIITNITLRDIIKNDNLFQQQNKFYKRGVIETEIIRRCSHAIGRTTWDKVHTLAINPEIHYHFCNETLRDPFYEKKWVYDKCCKHTIFISQASYPIKGLHILLKALPLVIDKYPDVLIKIAGPNITKYRTFKDKITLSGYGRYLRSYIKKMDLSKHIQFLGLLNEKEMCKELLCSNIFVCPSSIENSPNSVGEAQLLGVPCIASYVGGIPDMIPNDECGMMYRFEEFEMLAQEINEIFTNSSTFNNKSMICISNSRHDRVINRNTLLRIYKNLFINE